MYTVAWSPDGKTLASGSDDRTVKLWDAAAGKERAFEEALTIYQNFAKQDSEQFSPDVTRVKKLLELKQLPR